MSAKIIPFPAPMIRISKDLDVAYMSDTGFIRGVVRDLYRDHRAVCVAAAEDAASDAVRAGKNFHESMMAARDALNRMEAFYVQYHADKERK